MPKFTSNKVADSYFIECEPHYDERGYFQEVFQESKYHKNLDLLYEHKWRQVNRSFSEVNVLRGIHIAPYDKLCQCISGRIFDIVVDLRKGSPTYLQWDGIWLTGDNCKQLYVPADCGHGFYVAEPSTVLYLQGEVTQPDREYGVNWQDPKLKIDWNLACDPFNLILSEKDKNAKNIS